MPCRDEVVVTGEDRRLAIADLVADQLSCLSDDVQLIVVDLELWRSKRVHRVIDCQRMEVIRRLERVKFVGAGLAKRDPAEARARLILLEALVERNFPDSLAFLVIVGGDDAHADLAGMRRPRCTAGQRVIGMDERSGMVL